MTKLDLETRIADAFGAKLSSAQLSELLAEVAQADQEAKAASEAANEIALDPATRPDAVAKARKEMEDANFRRLRMERATTKLSEMKDAAEKRERDQAAQREREAAIAERDQLAKDLLEYDELAKKIVALLVRLKASDARVGRADSAEFVTRGSAYDSWFPQLVVGVRLPSFRRGEGYMGYLWPRGDEF